MSFSVKIDTDEDDYDSDPGSQIYNFIFKYKDENVKYTWECGDQDTNWIRFADAIEEDGTCDLDRHKGDDEEGCIHTAKGYTYFDLTSTRTGGNPATMSFRVKNEVCIEAFKKIKHKMIKLDKKIDEYEKRDARRYKRFAKKH